MRTIKLALAQTSAGDDWEANLEKGLRLMDGAAAQGAQAICFPEVGFRRFFPQYRAEKKYFEWAEPIPGPTTRLFAERARRHRMVTVVSVFEDAGLWGYFDSAAVLDADGTLLGVSRMMHIAEEPNYNEKYYYRPGNTDYPVFDTACAKIGIAICYDCRFPEHMCALSLHGAEMVLVPTAESGDPILKTWTIENQASSLANGIFIGVADRAGVEEGMRFNGRSFVTTPFGEVLTLGGPEADVVVLADVDLDQIRAARTTIPYLRDRRPETYGLLARL